MTKPEADGDIPEPPSPRHPDEIGEVPPWVISSSDEDTGRVRIPTLPDELPPPPFDDDVLRPVERELFGRLGRQAGMLRKLGTWIVRAQADNQKEHARTRAELSAQLARGLGDIAESVGRLAADDAKQRGTMEIVRSLATRKNAIGAFGLSLIYLLCRLVVEALQRRFFP